MKLLSQIHRLLWLALLAFLLVGTSVDIGRADPSGPRMGSASYVMDWSAVGEISGGGGSSASYRLSEATVSQMAANTTSASASYSLCTGLECQSATYWDYLPIILKP